jgi:hypothetical protein
LDGGGRGDSSSGGAAVYWSPEQRLRRDPTAAEVGYRGYSATGINRANRDAQENHQLTRVAEKWTAEQKVVGNGDELAVTGVRSTARFRRLLASQQAPVDEES